jgi:hypothetical protein
LPSAEAELEVIIEPEPVEISSTEFLDVLTTDWYAEAIRFVNKRGFMSGMDNGMFEPHMPTSRAMIASVLHRMSGGGIAGIENTFADVEEGKWYSQAVLWANESGLIMGYSESEYGVDDNVTREQLVTILYRFAKMESQDITNQAPLYSFSDFEQVSDWAKAGVEWAIANGLISGYADNTLSPKENASRAEIAQIIYLYSQKFDL